MRLITGGCSCTRHCWPTWADYLGMHFDQYINTASGGADNQTIARNVIDTAEAGDIVVVQWTGYDRFSTWDDDAQPKTGYSKRYNADLLMVEQCGLDRKKPKGSWVHKGSIVGSNAFTKHYYHPVERFRSTLDAVRSVFMHSQLKGYQVWHFTMTDWFLGESEIKLDQRLPKMHAREQIPNFYLKTNFMAECDPAGTGLRSYINHQYGSGDTHPQPMAHWLWLKNHIAPTVAVSLDLSHEDQVYLDQQRVINGDIA